MNVTKHLLNDIKPLHQNETVGSILDVMEELKYSHMPVVDEDKIYLGLVCEDDLLEINEEEPLQKHFRLMSAFSVVETEDVFRAISTIGKENLSLLPVVSAENKYLGYISAVELLQDIGRQISFSEPGSVLVLLMPSRDYHLAQLAQIVESDDAKIMGVMLVSDDETDQIRICLKINQLDLTRIVRSLERYNYKVVEVYHQSLLDEGMEDRFDAFMNYLNT